MSTGLETGTPPSWIILSIKTPAWSHSPSAIFSNILANGGELIPLAILLKYRYRKAARVSAASAWLRSSRRVVSFLTDKQQSEYTLVESLFSLIPNDAHFVDSTTPRTANPS